MGQHAASAGASTTRYEFQSLCNAALGKIVCPKHNSAPDPDRIIWRWFPARGASAASYWFMPQNNICGGVEYGACPTLTNLMQEEVFRLYQEHSPLDEGT